MRTRRIPNWLTLGGLAVAVAAQWFVRGTDGLWSALPGAATALALTLPLFALRGLGGGDVKLMTGVGAFTSPWTFLLIFAINAVLGGAVALVLALWKRRAGQTARNLGRVAAGLPRLQPPHRGNGALKIGGEGALALPRGAIFAVATCAVMLWS